MWVWVFLVMIAGIVIGAFKDAKPSVQDMRTDAARSTARRLGLVVKMAKTPPFVANVGFLGRGVMLPALQARAHNATAIDEIKPPRMLQQYGFVNAKARFIKARYLLVAQNGAVAWLLRVDVNQGANKHLATHKNNHKNSAHKADPLYLPPLPPITCGIYGLYLENESAVLIVDDGRWTADDVEKVAVYLKGLVDF